MLNLGMGLAPVPTCMVMVFSVSLSAAEKGTCKESKSRNAM